MYFWISFFDRITSQRFQVRRCILGFPAVFSHFLFCLVICCCVQWFVLVFSGFLLHFRATILQPGGGGVTVWGIPFFSCHSLIPSIKHWLKDITIFFFCLVSFIHISAVSFHLMDPRLTQQHCFLSVFFLYGKKKCRSNESCGSLAGQVWETVLDATRVLCSLMWFPF